MQFAIVDARNGRVYRGPEIATLGTEYRLDSSLLVMDSPALWRAAFGDGAGTVIGGYATATYYRWTASRLLPVDSVAIGDSVRWRTRHRERSTRPLSRASPRP